jgi:hypothetical protein
MIANAAFYFGLLQVLMTQDIPPEQQLPFAAARDNFYNAAHRGLDTHVTWLAGRRSTVRTLLLDELLPLARAGLARLEIDQDDIDRYLRIIEARVQSGQTGAAWQRSWTARHGKDMAGLTAAYREQQEQGWPVHEWRLD